MVEISNTDSDEDIQNTINYWLEHEDERLARAKKGQDYFLKKFENRNYVEDVVYYINRAKAGQRGMVFPYEWNFLPEPLPDDG